MNGVVECFRLAVAPGIGVALPGYLAVLIPQADGHHPVVQFVVVGLAVDQGDQRHVGLRVTGGPLPVTRQGGKLVRTGPSDTTTGGSTRVLINGKAVTQMSDETTLGGRVIAGNSTVLID